MRRCLTIALGLAAGSCNFDSNAQGDMGPNYVTVADTTGSTSATTTGGPEPTSVSSLDTSSTASTMTSADSSTGTSSPTSTFGVDSSSDDGSSGGETKPLSDEGLLARWYLDDAMMGMPEIMLADSAPDPVDLTLTYAENSPSFAEFEGNLGLQWPNFGLDGRPMAPIAGNKLETNLDGSSQFTVEIVLAVEDLESMLSRLFHIGNGAGTDLAIGAPDLDELHVRWGASEAVRIFNVSLTSTRQVLHIVVDTEERMASNRILVFRDGVPLSLAAINSGTPAQSAGLPISGGASMVLGNRGDGDRSFEGTLHYVALYRDSLSLMDLQNNAEVLLLSDDAP